MLIREQPQEHICIVDNFDTLLRMARRRQAPVLKPRGDPSPWKPSTARMQPTAP